MIFFDPPYGIGFKSNFQVSTRNRETAEGRKGLPCDTRTIRAFRDTYDRGIHSYLDQMLDIVVASDLSEWTWKDEDELEATVARGILSTEEADVIRAEGERVIEALNARRPPFDEPWDQWRPDPSWPAATLPQGWCDLGRYPPYGSGC